MEDVWCDILDNPLDRYFTILSELWIITLFLPSGISSKNCFYFYSILHKNKCPMLHFKTVLFCLLINLVPVLIYFLPNVCSIPRLQTVVQLLTNMESSQLKSLSQFQHPQEVRLLRPPFSLGLRDCLVLFYGNLLT